LVLRLKEMTLNEHKGLIARIDHEADEKIKQFEFQHNSYFQHIDGQINSMQQQINMLQHSNIENWENEIDHFHGIAKIG
jgi:hypothetical protein